MCDGLSVNDCCTALCVVDNPELSEVSALLNALLHTFRCNHSHTPFQDDEERVGWGA